MGKEKQVTAIFDTKFKNNFSKLFESDKSISLINHNTSASRSRALETIDGLLLACQAHVSNHGLFEYKIQTDSKDIFLSVPSRLRSIFDKCIGEDVRLKGNFDSSSKTIFRAKSLKLLLKEDPLEFIDFSRKDYGIESFLDSFDMTKSI